MADQTLKDWMAYNLTPSQLRLLSCAGSLVNDVQLQYLQAIRAGQVTVQARPADVLVNAKALRLQQ